MQLVGGGGEQEVPPAGQLGSPVLVPPPVGGGGGGEVGGISAWAASDRPSSIGPAAIPAPATATCLRNCRRELRMLQGEPMARGAPDVETGSSPRWRR